MFFNSRTIQWLKKTHNGRLYNFSFAILVHFKKMGENTFQQAWQSLKFVCSKFRTKLNLPLFKFCSVLAKHHLLVQREKEGFVKPEKLTGHWRALQQLYHSQLKENWIKHMGDIFLITCGCKINRKMHSNSYLGFSKTSIMPKICLCSLAFSKLVFLFLFCHLHLLLYFEEMFV